MATPPPKPYRSQDEFLKRQQQDNAKFKKRLAKVEAQMAAKRGEAPPPASPPPLKGGLNPEPPPRKIPAWQRPPEKSATTVQASPPKRVRKDPDPIEVRFPIPLTDEQKAEITRLLGPVLTHRHRYVTILPDRVLVTGVLKRDSKPIRDMLLKYRESICPRPIRLRASRD